MHRTLRSMRHTSALAMPEVIAAALAACHDDATPPEAQAPAFHYSNAALRSRRRSSSGSAASRWRSLSTTSCWCPTDSPRPRSRTSADLGIGHNGAIAGYLTVARHDPAIDVTIVVFFFEAADFMAQGEFQYDTAREVRAALGY